MRSQTFFVGLVVLALATPCWPLALTTFGKSSPQNNNNNNNQNDNKQSGERVQARECESDHDCRITRGTHCLENIFGDDSKMRCLCGDYREPKNGECLNKVNSVKARCQKDDECIEGAHCKLSNDSSFQGYRCFCMSVYEVDEDMQCSGSPSVFGFSALSLLASLLLSGNV